MKKLLVVVDCQNDFIDGALGTPEAVAIIPNVVEKIRNWDGDIIATLDTHTEDYLSTNEGKHLPVPHCINGTVGHQIRSEIKEELIEKNATYISKGKFGSLALAEKSMNYEYVELVGLCTDICVVSNALILKASFPEITIAVDPSCCAGVTPETHKAALTTMEMCQIEMVGEDE